MHYVKESYNRNSNNLKYVTNSINKPNLLNNSLNDLYDHNLSDTESYEYESDDYDWKYNAKNNNKSKKNIFISGQKIGLVLPKVNHFFFQIIISVTK